MSPAGDGPPAADGFRIPPAVVGSRVDVLRYPGEDDGEAKHRAVPAGEGAAIAEERENAAKRQWFTGQSTFWWVSMGLAPISLFSELAASVGLPYWTGYLWLAVVAALRWWYDSDDPRESTPEVVAENVPVATARECFDAVIDDEVETVTATVENAPVQPSTPNRSSTVASRSAGESTTNSALERSTDSSAPE
ncbi:hypothetical protein [Haloarchaeobius sp. HME9146]|uniref:hypothetical protein n=1 Tax=Haloarchaeobius sp. HME9146 TaxID=2978732 RepID=UPI0021BF48AD|nr:hypothetical protein [Haloarchaeobius sp. HME9146]MCT9095144.1 hypothetical protein [Haloarchaeobius sp. HME9146]